jgi:hypothetical protein
MITGEDLVSCVKSMSVEQRIALTRLLFSEAGERTESDVVRQQSGLTAHQDFLLTLTPEQRAQLALTRSVHS